MLGREARYESIKLNQPVTVVADTNRHMFYVFSGTIPNMPPYAFPDGPGDIPGPQRVAVWQVPHRVSFVMQPVTACVQGTPRASGACLTLAAASGTAGSAERRCANSTKARAFSTGVIGRIP